MRLLAQYTKLHYISIFVSNHSPLFLIVPLFLLHFETLYINSFKKEREKSLE